MERGNQIAALRKHSTKINPQVSVKPVTKTNPKPLPIEIVDIPKSETPLQSQKRSLTQKLVHLNTEYSIEERKKEKLQSDLSQSRSRTKSNFDSSTELRLKMMSSRLDDLRNNYDENLHQLDRLRHQLDTLRASLYTKSSPPNNALPFHHCITPLSARELSMLPPRHTRALTLQPATSHASMRTVDVNNLSQLLYFTNTLEHENESLTQIISARRTSLSELRSEVTQLESQYDELLKQCNANENEQIKELVKISSDISAAQEEVKSLQSALSDEKSQFECAKNNILDLAAALNCDGCEINSNDDVIKVSRVCINKFQIEDISVEEATARDALLIWCKKNTQGYDGVNITNFTTSWSSGLAFCALINHFRPELLDYNSLDKENHADNCKKAFEACEKLGITVFLDVEDLVDTTPDDKSVVTQVSEFFHFFASETKVLALAEKAKKIVGIQKQIYELKNNYDEQAKVFMDALNEAKNNLLADDYEQTVPSVKDKLVKVVKFGRDERPKLVELRGTAIRTWTQLVSNCNSHNRQIPTPPEGLEPETLTKALEETEQIQGNRSTELKEIFHNLQKSKIDDFNEKCDAIANKCNEIREKSEQ
ncbi:putative alpha-actinin [Histomonas meleagridis]|uniref:putative alpha-actinin n=1 Tax=Histomonas meleagridis TaxID=135588 RepID=UPI00355AC1C6|nr:putative alpha-actinin [Histomonas meleagridis]KAH0799475.1 putative alpha-actinin [Histomonas meleagridis]